MPYLEYDLNYRFYYLFIFYNIYSEDTHGVSVRNLLPVRCPTPPFNFFIFRPPLRSFFTEKALRNIASVQKFWHPVNFPRLWFIAHSGKLYKSVSDRGCQIPLLVRQTNNFYRNAVFQNILKIIHFSVFLYYLSLPDTFLLFLFLL